VCNGDATSLEPFTRPAMKLFHGKLVVVVQAGKKAGPAKLTVRDNATGLKQELILQVR
jgi:beta-galactosidase